MKDIVVIPAYQPDCKLIEITEELDRKGFFVLVVDDGSGEKYSDIFSNVRAEVVTMPKNSGKGAALKKAFSVIRDKYNDCECIITCDADGQHRIEDIVRVQSELHRDAGFVLTVRRRTGKIPFRSRIGNDLSKLVYTTLTGHYFSDNQSGLRGFRSEHLSWLTLPNGDKYDYEMNMLYYADKQSIPITTIPIDAIYIDGNSSSHFDPLLDTLRIYRCLFSSAWVSFVSAFLCELIVLFAWTFLGNDLFYITVPSAGIISAFFCVIINRFAVFKKVKYADGRRTIIFSILRFALYTLLCTIFYLLIPQFPLVLSFNSSVLLGVPIVYYIHSGLHYATYHDVNKE